MCQLDWPGATVSFDSLSWSRTLPVGILRTLQARLILNDDGDKAIFRQFGGESPLRTLKSGHTAIRADQFHPDGWQLQETAELCQNNYQGFVTNYMSAIAHMLQRPRCTDDNAPTGDNDTASTRSSRPQQKVPPNGNGTARSHRTNFLRHRLGSRWINK